MLFVGVKTDMNIYFSTNAMELGELYKFHDYIDEFEGKVGVELFPRFHQKGFLEEFMAEKKNLKKIPFSCHGPYYESEYAAPADSEEYQHSIELLKQTLQEVRDCKPVYMVFHHNNGIVTPETKKQKLLWARAGYEDVKAICDKENIPLVVENVSLTCHQSMLFEEQEFIDECKRIQCPVLIDIGHANISGWNLRRMMEELRDQIVSYHVHNNAGKKDDHNRIFCGTLDFESFIEDYKRLTPDADIVLEYCPEAVKDIEETKKDIQYLISNCL